MDISRSVSTSMLRPPISGSSIVKGKRTILSKEESIWLKNSLKLKRKEMIKRERGEKIS